MRNCYNWGGLIAVLCAVVVLTGGIDQLTKDALKVGHILRTIERQHPRSGGDSLSAEVTEREVNAYIAHRLKQENRPFIHSLTVDLLDHDQVRGKIRLDAQRLNLDVLLGEELDFDFKGLLYTRDSAARLDLISLHLGGQPVDPQVLDFVFSTAGMVYGTVLGGIADWYELPKGIKRIAVTKSKAILYY